MSAATETSLTVKRLTIHTGAEISYIDLAVKETRKLPP